MQKNIQRIMQKVQSTKSYKILLRDIVRSIQNTRISAARKVNKELVMLYWHIGEMIVEKQRSENWGDSVVETLAADLRKQFPDIEGFSARNLWDMRRLYERYKDNPKLRQLVAELPWGHNLVLLNKVTDRDESRFYMETAASMGWSRNILLNQIKAKAYKRQKQLPKQHNFKKALPAHLSEQAEEMLKSSYNLGFLGIAKPLHERQFENRLIEKLKQFLLELGVGFSFVGNQYRVELNSKEYFIDLLFYHRRLKCLVAIDLKIGVFEPEFAGKMNFYLNLLDDKVRMKDENPSIGIILCADKNSVEVDYALKGIDKPIAVAEYQLQKTVPKKFQRLLPSANDLQRLIRGEIKRNT